MKILMWHKSTGNMLVLSVHHNAYYNRTIVFIVYGVFIYLYTGRIVKMLKIY